MNTPLSFGNLPAAAGNKSPSLRFPGDPMPTPWGLGSVNLDFGKGVPSSEGQSTLSRVFSGIGWDLGTSASGGGGGSSGGGGGGTVTTAQVDGGAPWLDGLKGLTTAVLGSIGSTGDRGEVKAQPVMFERQSSAGLDVTTLALIGAGAFAIYYIASGSK